MSATHAEVSTPTQHVLEQALSTRTRAQDVDKKHNNGRVHLEKGSSPIMVKVLEAWLKHYPRRKDANYVLEGFKYGF